MSERYSYQIDTDGSVSILDPQGTPLGSVESKEDGETLVPYLNAGEGGFTIATHSDTDTGRSWVFVNPEDVWTAYTGCPRSAETILGHLNRHD